MWCSCTATSDALRRRAVRNNIIIYNPLLLLLRGFGLVSPTRVLFTVLLPDDPCLDLIKLLEGWRQIPPGRSCPPGYIHLFLSFVAPVGFGDPEPVGAEDHKAVRRTRNPGRFFCWLILRSARHCLGSSRGEGRIRDSEKGAGNKTAKNQSFYVTL